MKKEVGINFYLEVNVQYLLVAALVESLYALNSRELTYIHNMTI
jgi:hypothetical protein